MEYVYIHIGKKPIPNYFWQSVKQTRNFYDGNIYAIVQEKELSKLEYGVIGVAAEELLNERCEEFSNLYSFMNNKDMLGDFWFVTAQRLFFLENFMKRYDKKNIIHLEYDNILYEDLNIYDNIFKEIYKDSVVVGLVSDDSASAGLIYVDKHGDIEFLNNAVINILKNNNKKFITEMTMLKFCLDNFPDKIKTYPTLPYGEKYSNNICLFNSIFDPATWGQYVGGINTPFRGGHKPSGKESICLNHEIGKDLASEKCDVVWENNKFGKVPFVRYTNGEKWKLNNLHIHSKELHKYV